MVKIGWNLFRHLSNRVYTKVEQPFETSNNNIRTVKYRKFLEVKQLNC